MPFSSCNPVSNIVLRTFPTLDAAGMDALLVRVREAQSQWRNTDPETRARLATTLADLMRERKVELAALATLEMGKTKKEALAEIEKCALCCDYYSVHAAPFLEDEP